MDGGPERWLVIQAPEEGVKVQRGMMVSVYYHAEILQGEVGRVVERTETLVGFEVTAQTGQKWELEVPLVWSDAGLPELESGWESDRATDAGDHGSAWGALAALFSCGSASVDD